MDHHNFTTDINPELARRQQQNDQAQLGATGRYPDGKLSENDEGELQFAVDTLNNHVVLDFGKPVSSCAFSVKQAREVALALRRHANQIERGTVRNRR